MLLRKSPRRFAAAKIGWIAYATLGSFLFVWDLSATREHILGSLMVAAYSFPSSYITHVLFDPLFVHGTPPTINWVAMVGLNGGLVFAAIYVLPGGKEQNA